MAFASTQLNVTTAAAAIISADTTWGNIARASGHEPFTLMVVSLSTAALVHLVGTQSATGAGVPLTTAGTVTAARQVTIVSPSDVLFARTTGSTATIAVLVDRQ